LRKEGEKGLEEKRVKSVRAKLNQLDQKGIDYNAGHGAAAASSQIMHHSSRSRIQPFQSAISGKPADGVAFGRSGRVDV
jgi:hypothetical protein